ncbi:MAG TPA: CBS domain-containing protein [Anaeromyxobacteraceae bacterium]|nr:CBS domain-containing protein [Anaeromyxobacteraceae bacterium]
MLVRTIMTPRAEVIGPDETLEVAATRMREAGIGALVVCEGEELLGILTDRDIVVRSTAQGRNPAEADVRSAMTPQLISCHADEDLEGAIRRMEEGAVRRVVVVDEASRVVGMLSVDDIALRSPSLAGEVIEHMLAPERPVHRGTWPWWEEALAETPAASAP